MKTIKLLLIIILFCSAAGTSRAVRADDDTGGDTAGDESYVVIKGGLFYPAGNLSLDNFNDPGHSELDMKNGLNGELALGQYSNDFNMASELGIGYFESKGAARGEPGSARLKAVPIFITWKIFSPVGALQPYLEFGLGGYYATLRVSGNTGIFSSQSTLTYGFHGGLGFNIDLGSTMFTGLEARYVWAKPDFGGQHIDLSGICTSINIGFKY